MPSFVQAEVTAIIAEHEDLQKVEVRRDDGGAGSRAYVLPHEIGPVAVGDRVIVNTTAVELGLGTGGWHFVHWNLSRDAWHATGGGHILKARYTSLQTDAGSTEEHLTEPLPSGLDGVPVVACTLLSQVAPVVVAVRDVAPDARIVLVVTDQGALALATSDLVRALRERGLVDVTVTCGQAFGGDREAVNIVTGLRVARHVEGAAVIVVSDGFGVAGTATPEGASSMSAISALDAAAHDGGSPILAVRWSDADARERHRGMSHHSASVLARASAAVAPLPSSLLPAAIERSGLGAERFVPVDVPDVAALLAGHGLRVTTMGRGPEDDTTFFTAAAAAGALAARRAERAPSPPH